MGIPKRIRRSLTLKVSERQPENPNETWTPGARFAAGWALYGERGASMAISLCHGDPIKIAGYLAAEAAFSAHNHAVNWIEL